MRCASIVVGVLLALLGVGESRSDEKLPIPTEAQQTEALETIRSIFARDYESKKPEDVAKLVTTLLSQARNPGNDANNRYSLFREAIQLSSTLGDAETTFAAIDDMDRLFAIDKAKVTLYSIHQLYNPGVPEDQQAKLFGRSEQLAMELASQREPQLAGELCRYTVAYAGRVGDAETASKFQKLQQGLEEYAQHFEKAQVHLETLAKNPNDATANLEVGKLECFSAGKWEAGLPLLAKGKDAILAELAEKTLAGADDAASQYKIANYTVSATFTKAGQSFINLVVPVRDRYVTLYLDVRFKVDRPSFGGFALHRDKNIWNNPTRKQHPRIDNGKSHVVKCDVSCQGDEVTLTLILDNKQISKWKGPIAALKPDRSRPKQPHLLGLQVTAKETRFHDVSLTFRSGSARLPD